jgi:hypothetical protein
MLVPGAEGKPAMAAQNLIELSTQLEWDNVRDEFPNRSSYRAFRARYQCNPNSRIILTGRPIQEVLRPDAVLRRSIFEQCFQYGRTVQDITHHAAQMPGRAEPDADIFIGLFADYIRFFE